MKKASTIMTTKKYVITFIIFALLSVLTLTLFFGGLFIKEHNLIAFYILIAFSCISFVFSIIFIAINYKELVNYDIKKLNKQIDNLDFSIIDISISESDLKSKLIGYGYTNTKDIFHKVVDENYGDGNIVNHYYATIHKTNEVMDIQDILKSFGKGMTTYNIGYIFINENVDENIEIIKNYIKATILDVKVHPYKYKKFFVPILINNNKVYYIKEKGIFMNTYQSGVVEGMRIIKYQ